MLPKQTKDKIHYSTEGEIELDYSTTNHHLQYCYEEHQQYSPEYIKSQVVFESFQLLSSIRLR